MRPLEGIRVIDLTHVLAGPYCAYQLGLLGADVIKVESPRGDMVRGWGGSETQVRAGFGTGFTAQNAGKRSIVIDIKTDAGAALVRRMVERADVFLENYRPGRMAKRGLGDERLRALNPKLIYASISAFGQNGPLGPRPGFDDVVQATSGFMSINVRGDGPIRTGGPVLDYATGMHATSAVLAALMLRQQTGEGQRVDVAMQDVTTLLMNRNAHIAASTGTPPPPADNRDGPLLGRFETKDGYVMLAGYLPNHQRSILGALELPEFAGLSGRQLAERETEIVAAVEARLMERTSAEWDARFAQLGVVAGGVADLAGALATGQPEARALYTEVDTDHGKLSVTNSGYRINDEVYRPGTPPPALNADRDSVLADFGVTDDERDHLLDAGAIA